MQRLSIEVIDILREISREFKNEIESDEEANNQKIIQINNNLNLPISGFSAIQYELPVSRIGNKNPFIKDLQNKDKIYLIGGQDKFGNILDSVFEYSVKDM